MGVRIDSNGKVFTDRVRKERVVCVIQTVNQRIRGNVFHDPDNRLMDELNGEAGFIAVGDAQVLSLEGVAGDRTPFMMLNKRHVVWVLPAEESEHGQMDSDH